MISSEANWKLVESNEPKGSQVKSSEARQNAASKKSKATVCESDAF